ncbi:hypothetical protein SAMN05421778_109134 [Sphaerotilus natans]|nr:hypothetical protein SAMN05421778_109134 [Sphaerotilus natans]
MHAVSSAPAVALASWYLLDRDNRVIDVSPDWDAAAQAGQGGGNAFRDGVIGRPLGRFLAGDTTRMFIESALQAVRLTQQPRLLNYRCDAPALSRQMQMRLQPLPDGWVRVEHMLVQARPRATALRFETCSAVLLPSPGTPPWLRCSICLWVCTPQGYWEPPEHVHAARPLQVDYVVCPRCQAEMTPPG